MWRAKSMADRFDIYHPARLRSTVLEDIWRQAYDQDYAADAKPNGFYSLSVLDRVVAAGADLSRRTLLDIGCGYGKTSLFLAQRMDMKLYSTDNSPVGIEPARKDAAERDIAAKCWVADASSTDLKDGVCAIFSCLDVLLYLPDKLAFLKEMHRVPEPAGLFICTTWEQHGYSQRLGAEQLSDYRPLLEQAGFQVQYYDEVDGAREQQSRVLDGLLSRQEEMRSEPGETPAEMFTGMARSARDECSGRRYVFCIVRRNDV